MKHSDLPSLLGLLNKDHENHEQGCVQSMHKCLTYTKHRFAKCKILAASVLIAGVNLGGGGHCG